MKKDNDDLLQKLYQSGFLIKCGPRMSTKHWDPLSVRAKAYIVRDTEYYLEIYPAVGSKRLTKKNHKWYRMEKVYQYQGFFRKKVYVNFEEVLSFLNQHRKFKPLVKLIMFNLDGIVGE